MEAKELYETSRNLLKKGLRKGLTNSNFVNGLAFEMEAYGDVSISVPLTPYKTIDNTIDFYEKRFGNDNAIALTLLATIVNELNWSTDFDKIC